MIVSHSVLENNIVLHWFRVCFMSFSKILLFSYTFLGKCISKYLMGFGPIVGRMFFSISPVYCWHRKKDIYIQILLLLLFCFYLFCFNQSLLGFSTYILSSASQGNYVSFSIGLLSFYFLFQNNFKFIKSCKNKISSRNNHIPNC